MTRGWERKVSKKGEDDLGSKVLKIPPELISNDSKGEYLPYCDYEYHKGIIIDENVCQSRGCHHYYKFRIDESNRVY